MLHTSRSSYKWSPWTNIDRWSEPRAMGVLCRHPPVLEVAQHSVNPCLVGGVRTVVSGREPAAQRADRPVLLRFTGSVNHRCGEADRGDSKQTVSYDRVSASRNRCSVAPLAT
jgi:hypothetical protein